MVQMLHSYNSIYFWVFCGALFVNCLYPFVLFNTSSTWWRRDAVAFVDIGLVCFLPNPSPSSCRNGPKNCCAHYLFYRTLFQDLIYALALLVAVGSIDASQFIVNKVAFSSELIAYIGLLQPIFHVSVIEPLWRRPRVRMNLLRANQLTVAAADHDTGFHHLPGNRGRAGTADGWWPGGTN